MTAPHDPSAKTEAMPPPLMARAPRPSAVRIRRSVVQGVVMGAGLLLAGSLTWAFVIQPDMQARARALSGEDVEPVRGAVRPSERVTDQPASYDRLPASDGLPPPRQLGLDSDAPPVDAVGPVEVERTSSYTASPPTISAAQTQRQEAAASGLFFGQGPMRSAAPSAPTVTADERDRIAVYSPHGLTAPISPYELKAGSWVPAVLLTAVDTARPGPVVAVVSQNVFDTVSGRHLLLPQGARLIGRHEGESAHGDNRAFLVWDRIILPNGKSLILAEEPGVDGQGAVGVRGDVDRRLWPLGVASLFAGAISTIGELARGGDRHESRSFIASAGDAASIEAAQVGGRLIDRELQVRPSIRVVAGASVRVMITRDLVLEPYRP